MTVKGGIKAKLVAAFLVMGMVPALTVGAIFLTHTAAELESQAFSKLDAVREAKSNELTAYFETVRDQAITMSRNHMVASAMREFAAAFRFLKTGDADAQRAELASFYADQFAPYYSGRNEGAVADVDSLQAGLSDIAVALQYHYIHANPHPIGEKDELVSVAISDLYNKTHEKYHESLRFFVEKFGYEDLLLIDIQSGEVVYSVAKDVDFATSLRDGPLADSNLGALVREVSAFDDGNAYAFADFAPFLPAYDAPASFIASPVYDGAAIVGVLALQIPIQRISAIAGQRTGLGETGELVLVGPDRLMRSDSFVDPDGHTVEASFRHPDTGSIETRPVLEALAGGSGTTMARSYHGGEVLSAYAPIDVLGASWAIVAEIDADEALAAVSSMTWLMAVVGLFGSMAIVACGYVIGRGLAGPIVSMTSAMVRLADGDLKVEVPALERGDEIGSMAAAVEVFKTHAVEVAQIEEQQRADEERVATERRELMLAMADEFETRVGGIVRTVTSAVAEMQVTAERMAQTASGTRDQSMAAASASEQASANVETVAAAAEELSSSISEIARQVEQSSSTASKAVEDARATDQTIRGLAEAARRIGEVVSLITDIADQTNLLALNATIEAARAGEAGKGFAVVASEVKQLAAQTSRATEEISAHITQIQASTGEAVRAIEQIGSTISETSQIATVIATAVEEQGTATAEIAHNVEQTATGTREVSSTIRNASEAASETGAAASEIAGAVGELTRQSELLREEVDKFLANVRAA